MYENNFTRANPGLIVILVDQSGSMSIEWTDGKSLAEQTAMVINRCIAEIGFRFTLKIKIQIFANEAYALINKNESHIRMSSSTWHIAKLLIVVTGVSSLVFLAKALIMIKSSGVWSDITQYVAFVLPFSMLLLVLYIRNSVVKYIHYQRMREIQYTLQIYHQFKSIIDFRQQFYSSHDEG